MYRSCLLILLFWCGIINAQYSFSGYIDTEEWQNTVYLSIVEDYRKISGVFSEQIIGRAYADATGFFEFKGDMLDAENRIYRIHIDKCSETQRDINHFNGRCDNSLELLFIANNHDILNLPLSFGNQVFCDIESSNPKANAFVKIDSLKEDMRFAYGEYRSQANRKLNNKKWFKTLQDYGKKLNEPLAELYIYSYISDRSSDLHNYYVEDLKNNPYYDKLKIRLQNTYPKAPYTKQYISEIEADKYMLAAFSNQDSYTHNYLIYGLLFTSILINFYLVSIAIKTRKTKTKTLREKLSKQEQVVLDHLLKNKSNKDIASSLFLSVSTVKTHTNNIYKKLNVQSRDEAKSLFNK
ncbi:response regulator transcription factor [Winogradskyella alexanderae]|uniref:LuxR C-terminal-related transcriptional regulator n=1 Tax=Winogradskyella alexanderae TaxID=2877123 RepID=A0ABS7XUY9_9FLAO|nr:LuxR C-terminal-related transcriptional regulator [Winogradskyella alexanderae]MCA0133253.1 LuxR C-terminal-related transcriptional regulator [Winogradskyella alexanderae]